MKGLKAMGAFLVGPLCVGLLSIMVGRFSMFEWIFTKGGSAGDYRLRFWSVLLTAFAACFTYGLWRASQRESDSPAVVRQAVIQGVRGNIRRDLAGISGERRRIFADAAEKKIEALNL